jgi:hypothetical protein
MRDKVNGEYKCFIDNQGSNKGCWFVERQAAPLFILSQLTTHNSQLVYTFKEPE